MTDNYHMLRPTKKHSRLRVLFVLVLFAQFAGIVVRPTPVAAQGNSEAQFRLSGYVLNGRTKDAIIGASIALLGTTRGTIANRDGRFSLLLPANRDAQLRISAVGFIPDTIVVHLNSDDEKTITLEPKAVESGLITVTADQSRERARQIMRDVIAQKEQWHRSLQSYQFNIYSRFDINTIRKPDTTFISLLESHANGYWEAGKGYAERITARKQTANLPADINKLSLLDVPAFYEERVKVGSINVATPVAQDAFTFYDFDYLGEDEINGVQAYKILVEPRGSLRPAFAGTLWVDKLDTIVVRIDYTANDAVTVSPLHDLRFVQNYRVVDNRFPMPSDGHDEIGVKFQLPFIPGIYIDHYSVIDSYRVNLPIPDTIFSKMRHQVEARADSLDSLQWISLRAVPLTMREEQAYRTIDSLHNTPRPEAHIEPINVALGLLLNPDIYQYNRVEGSRLEVTPSFDHLGPWPLSFDGLMAYGIGDNQFKYSAELRQGLLWTEREVALTSIDLNGNLDIEMEKVPTVTWDIGGKIYDDVQRRGKTKSIIMNTLSALVFKSDYPNYYRGKGFELSTIAKPVANVSATLGYREERQLSLPVVATWSLLSKSKTFRDNPQINEGLMREAFGNVTWVDYGIDNSYGLQITGNVNPSTFKGDFNFSASRVSAYFAHEFGGWGQLGLWASAAAILHGAMGNQHLYYFESPVDFTRRARRFLTMKELEYQGDKIAMFFAEQDLRDLPVRALGLSFLKPYDIHWIAFANVGASSITEETKQMLVEPIKTTGRGPYLEAGAGISNIFNILRLDFAWRITHRIPGRNFTIKDTWSLTF